MTKCLTFLMALPKSKHVLLFPKNNFFSEENTGYFFWNRNVQFLTNKKLILNYFYFQLF